MHRDRIVSDSLSVLPDGSLRVAGTALLTDVVRNADVIQRFPLLAAACEQSGSASVREGTSVAGDLLQPPRCSYLRHGIPCLKNGGTGCPAHDGDNSDLAILEGGPCWIVHPSDVAIALVALDAHVDVAGPAGNRSIAAAEFFVLPSVRIDRETVLLDGEHIAAIRIPANASGGLQRYTRIAEPAATAGPIVSLAMTRRTDGEARLVLGGVAPRPYRIYTSVEEEATSGGLDEDTIAVLAERALLDAVPLSKNEFKFELASALLRDAIREIDSTGS